MKSAARLVCLGIATIAFGLPRVSAQTTPLISPDATKYFTEVDIPNQDNTEWRVYLTKPDRLIWKGRSGIVGKHPKLGYDAVLAQLSKPRWTANGEFEASLICGRKVPPITVKLVQQGNKWLWQPALACPPD